jgi:hypothetical protein
VARTRGSTEKRDRDPLFTLSRCRAKPIRACAVHRPTCATADAHRNRTACLRDRGPGPGSKTVVRFRLSGMQSCNAPAPHAFQPRRTGSSQRHRFSLSRRRRHTRKASTSPRAVALGQPTATQSERPSICIVGSLPRPCPTTKLGSAHHSRCRDSRAPTRRVGLVNFHEPMTKWFTPAAPSGVLLPSLAHTHTPHGHTRPRALSPSRLARSSAS